MPLVAAQYVSLRTEVSVTVIVAVDEVEANLIGRSAAFQRAAPELFAFL